MNGVWRKIQGIVNGFLKFGFLGPRLSKNGTDNDQLDITGNNGVSDAKVNVATAKTKQIEVRDVNGLKTVITQPVLAEDQALKLPTTKGNFGDSVKTDGNGNLFFSGGGDAADLSAYQYTINHNTASPANLVDMPENFRISDICLEVITPFNGTAPQVEIGVAGDIARYVSGEDVDLKNAGKYVFEIEYDHATAAQMLATITPDGSTAGTVKITVSGYVPAVP